MSYTDLDPDYYDRQQQDRDAAMYYINRERQAAGLLPLPSPSRDVTMLEMQFADPDWQPDDRPFAVHRPEPAADPDVNTQVEVPELLYTVYDSESSRWVDVPFHVAWLFYGLFMLMGQLLVFGFSTMLFHWPLGVYVMWGILNLLALPFLSYWWTKHARDRHYAKLYKNGQLQEVRTR